jgi:hypothetical protein
MPIVLDGTAGITTPDLTDTSLTSGRVVYAGASGNLTGSANLTYVSNVLSQTGRLQVYNTTGADGGFRLSSTGDVSFYDFEVTDSTGLAIQQGNSTRFTINNDGNVKLNFNLSVGNATPTTSGFGITFPATQSASSDANTLDDYEEGTWTPSLPNGGTLNVNAAKYTKIGRQVTISFFVDTIAPTNNSSAFVIGGLPFTATDNYGASIGFVGDGNLSGFLAIVLNGTTTVGFRVNTGSAAARTNAEYITAASGSQDALIITATYFV